MKLILLYQYTINYKRKKFISLGWGKQFFLGWGWDWDIKKLYPQ